MRFSTDLTEGGTPPEPFTPRSSGPKGPVGQVSSSEVLEGPVGQPSSPVAVIRPEGQEAPLPPATMQATFDAFQAQQSAMEKQRKKMRQLQDMLTRTQRTVQEQGHLITKYEQ